MSTGALRPFQIEVARMFFNLPESRSFLLAGGAGLLAQDLTHRSTEDLDLFTRIAADVQVAARALESAAAGRGWSTERIRDGDTFCRLVITNEESLLVDLAQDSPPQMAASMTCLGPTFAPEELAARKLLALFDRAAARDFPDVYELTRHFDRDQLVAMTASLDLGFTTELLGQSMAGLARYRDEDLPVDASEVQGLRAYFEAWAEQLLSRARPRE